MAKRKRGMKKEMMNSEMHMHHHHSYWSYAWVKLSAMAFILFLITVWPAAMTLVHSIHWGWFLGATIIFGAIAMKNCCGHKM